ncbi:unnamed protein product [Haemonchus placei]|uniref:Uncharacterized protein n=1 Tax=Haemonchus placei TaxID=6290 RepID=A0A0N4X793_HAEPC|nr:unnamed protein product [Haemonchus placei]
MTVPGVKRTPGQNVPFTLPSLRLISIPPMMLRRTKT